MKENPVTFKTMGNTDTKLNFRKTIIQLGTKNQVNILQNLLKFSQKQNTYMKINFLVPACIGVAFFLDKSFHKSTKNDKTLAVFNWNNLFLSFSIAN